MSSTNRGYERHKTDYYVTPHQPVVNFLTMFLQCTGIKNPNHYGWFDPCAGGDDKNEMTYPYVIENHFGVDSGNILSSDIRFDSRADVKANYLTLNIDDFNPDIIITNPPFFIALDIIKKALSDVNDNGYVIMLLRLNFFGSKERKLFFDEHMPEFCFIHSKRISFMNGATDSIEYAHFVWRKNYKPEFTKTYVI